MMTLPIDYRSRCPLPCANYEPHIHQIQVTKVATESLTALVSFHMPAEAGRKIVAVGEGSPGDWRDISAEEFTQMKNDPTLKGMEKFSTVEDFNKWHHKTANGWAIWYNPFVKTTEKTVQFVHPHTLTFFKEGRPDVCIAAAAIELRDRKEFV